MDEDEECHNPSEESTTLCPLLPGQRLNVLELPSEGHSRSLSDTSDPFTRNPKDRYLTPVPPAPLQLFPSPQLGAATIRPYAMPPPSPWAPRSATYPPANGLLTPNVVRHARSASASPRMPSTPLFPDFKVLRDKLASKRAVSRNRSSSKSKELEIGSPVLISTTNEELNLIPLSVYQPSLPSFKDSPSANTRSPRPVPTIRREFSPLASHPVDPDNDSIFNFAEPPTTTETVVKRRRSHVPSTVVTSEFKLSGNRGRANSSDTRRTQHYLFSNDPWLSSPKYQQEFEAPDRVVDDDTPSAPVLERPSPWLGTPAATERPTSSYGGDTSPKIQRALSNKELPALPQYLTPAPLFACISPSVNDTLTEEPLEELEEDEDTERLEDLRIQFQEKSRSHFSTWSSHSLAYSCSTSDDEAVESPTFSSLTSNCSDTGSPQRRSILYSFVEETEDDKRTPTTLEHDGCIEDEDVQTVYFSATPPQLDDLRISTFGSDLFNLDIQHADSAPRRQAACFGLGVYSLPDTETASKTTITESSLKEPTFNVQRDSSTSQLNALMDDFAFLGESVI